MCSHDRAVRGPWHHSVFLLHIVIATFLAKAYAASAPTANYSIANTLTIHFDDVVDGTSVLDHYSSDGITFSSDAVVYKEAHLGGHGFFSDEPSCPNAVTHPVSPSFTMNVPGTE